MLRNVKPPIAASYDDNVENMEKINKGLVQPVRSCYQEGVYFTRAEKAAGKLKRIAAAAREARVELGLE